MADGPAAGLHLIDALAREGALDGYHLLHAARADLLRRLGRRPRRPPPTAARWSWPRCPRSGASSRAGAPSASG